jgi:TolB-like protein/tetratricopeptide (TPR) repeat protein
MPDAPPSNLLSFPDPASTAAQQRLDSWKEIAAYLNRGARTVQRWEREEGLPVHRLKHDQGSTVYAYKQELDAWWTSRRAETPALAPACREYGASVAVLPFTDMSREKDQEYFCEGIAEEIINALSRLKGLHVASRTSAFQFKGTQAGSREIGSRLNVKTLLEGSVRKAGDRLRISVQLTDAETGFQLWSDRYDRQLSDVFAIQDGIARNIVKALKVTLTTEESDALRKAPTGNVQAYDYYLRGRKFYFHYNRRDIEFAIEMFTKAISLDSGFAAAHAGLADCWSYIYLYAERSETALAASGAASLRAVALDAKSAQAWAARAVSLSIAGSDVEAERAFNLAIELDPDLFEAQYFYARHCFVAGRQDMALELYEEAMRIRPEDYQAPLLAAQSYDDLGRPEEARASRELGVRLAENRLAANPEDSRAVYMAANGMVALGRKERGKEWCDMALAMAPDEPMLLYNVGCVYSMLGLEDQAMDCLERAVRNGLTQKGWYLHDSNLDPLRGRPRFERLLESLS